MENDFNIVWLIGSVVTLVIGAGFGYVSSKVTGAGDVIRKKSPEDRVLTDKLILEAEKRIEAMNVDRLSTFITSFILSRLPDMATKVTQGITPSDPMDIVKPHVSAAMSAWERRNKDTATQVKIGTQSMQEKLAGELVNQAGDLFLNKILKK